MENKELYNQLTKLVNSTFGTTGPGASVVSGQKVNFLVRNDSTLEAQYTSTVTFTSDKNLDSLTHKYRNEAYALIEASLKKLAKEYNKSTGNTLVFEINTNTARENVDYLSYNIYSSMRRAFFHLTCLVAIDDKKGKKKDEESED